MVHRIVHFECEKCRKRFGDYDEARSCEISHVADDAIEGFRKDLAQIFPKRKYKTTVKQP